MAKRVNGRRWFEAAGDDAAAAGARSVMGRRARLAALAAVTVLIALRLPHAWSEGRFLDEEATVFLAYAWHRPWLDALLRPFAGYWNLAANASTLAVATLVGGGVVPLERAPFVTMGMALAAQSLPAMLILTGRARWLAARPAVIAALLLLAVMPATEEVFFNVLHIQFHLTLCVALILALDAPTRRRDTIGYAVLLFAAPLCGPGAIVLLPLFVLRGLVDRDAVRLAQAAALAAGAAIQLLLFFGANPMRGHLLDPATLAAALFARLIVLPLLGFRTAFHVGVAVHGSWLAGGAGWWAAAGFTVIAFAALVVIAARRRDATVWLVLSALALAASSFGYGMVIFHDLDLFSAGAGERYNFVPSVLLGLAMVALAMREGRGRFGAMVVVVFALIVGARDYLHPLSDYARGPSWRSEVAAWRRDHRHPLAVWPRPWAADLSDTARPCGPIGHGTDPRYCESGWVAGFHRPPPSER